MPSVITLVVCALAVARVTRLVAADRITDKLRIRVIRWAYLRDCSYCHEGTKQERGNKLRLHMSSGPEPMLAYLITCRWCASVWVAALATPLVCWFGSSPWLFWPAFGLAASHLTGLLAKLEG